MKHHQEGVLRLLLVESLRLDDDEMVLVFPKENGPCGQLGHVQLLDATLNIH